jgi:hypothetical protein
MVRSPAGRRAPGTGGASPDQWLEVPGWRGPLDTLIVLAVILAGVWVGLVVIPSAANSDQPAVTDRTTQDDASPPTAVPSQDPSQWIAGPVYIGGPAGPTTEQGVVAAAPVVVAQPPAHRATARQTATHAAPRTTAMRPAPKGAVAAAVPAPVTTPAVAAAATTSTPAATTTPPAPTTTATETTTPTSDTTTPSTSSASDPTTSSPTSSSEPPPGP